MSSSSSSSPSPSVHEQTLSLRRWAMSPPPGHGPALGLTLAGYSRAGAATFFYVPEWKIQLDMGGFSREFQPTSFFVTHSHLDHCMYLPDVQPAFQEGRAESRLYVPKRMDAFARTYLHSAQELNNLEHILPENEKPYTLIPTQGGQSFEVSKGVRVRVIDCTHTIDTVGYLFYALRLKLKKEYEHLPGAEIGKLRKAGVPVSEELELPQFAFLGDTTERVFSLAPELFTFPVVIVECTHLLDEHLALAEPSGHMHWRHVETIARAHPATMFVLTHWSNRYKNEEIKAFFAAQTDLPANVLPWISSVR